MIPCMEAQFRVQDYIDGKLSLQKSSELLEHVENCAVCREELNITYTVSLGLKQLDQEDDVQELSDPEHFLQKMIEGSKKRIAALRHFNYCKRGIYLVTVMIMVVALIFQIGIFIDMGIL